MSSKRINELGWHPKIKLKEGITSVYKLVDKSGW
ncbi:MAG: nucleoside-diphosphate-sugar epimerase [Cyclobacteriaceae bacterium]|jgi:nucleoside-diphosphate-sugar epimerase